MAKKNAVKWIKELSRDRVPKNHVRVVADKRRKNREREVERVLRDALKSTRRKEL